MDLSKHKYYNWAPFFTLQKRVLTRKQQKSLWMALILGYCQTKKISELVPDDAANNALFNNKRLGRKLSRDAVVFFLEGLVDIGRAEWADKKKTKCKILYKTPVEWSVIIHNFVQENGYTDSVLTFFELLQGETGENSAFFGLDEDVFRKSLKVLEKKGKAELMKIGGDEGVKFF